MKRAFCSAWCGLGWLAALSILAPGAASDASSGTEGDAALRKGVARYHYYQQDYLPALSELMVARERQSDDDLAPVLEGAIRLAFGMANSAEAQLQDALADRPAQRDAARFYLGKLYYLRGDWAAATHTWAGMSDALASGLAQEQRALEWQLASRLGQVEAPDPRQLWRELGLWAPSVLYNLGGERARAGDYEQARHYYRALTDQAPRSLRDNDSQSNEEYRVLKDRAHTAAAFTLLLEQESALARTGFARVRLDRPEASRALLGYGWAAAQEGDYISALRPWQALQQRPLTDSSVQEALLALPHAYEQLQAPADALDAYDRAEALLEREQARVRVLRVSMDGPTLLAAIAGDSGVVPLNAQSRQNWLSLGRASVAVTDNDYLQHWVQQSQFQARVQALGDLLDQRALLLDWQPKLVHYAELLEDKQALRHSRQAQLAREDSLSGVEVLQARRDHLAERLARIERERDYLALADRDAQSLYAMVQAAEGRLERLRAAGIEEGDRLDAGAERLRRYRGLLLWQAAQAYPDNLWQHRKQLAQLDTHLTRLLERRDRVEGIVAFDPDIAPSLARMAQLDNRIQTQVGELNESLNRRATFLAEDLQQHLQDHDRRLDQYLARVRLAAARLQDNALGDASAPRSDAGASL